MVTLMSVVQHAVIQVAAALIQQDMVHQVLMALLDQRLNLSILKWKIKGKKTHLKYDYFNVGTQMEQQIIRCTFTEREGLIFSCN